MCFLGCCQNLTHNSCMHPTILPTVRVTKLDVSSRNCRHYFLQEQQEEIMTEHHKMRASEVPPYAQAMVLAGLLEQYDNMVRSLLQSS